VFVSTWLVGGLVGGQGFLVVFWLVGLVGFVWLGWPVRLVVPSVHSSCWWAIRREADPSNAAPCQPSSGVNRYFRRVSNCLLAAFIVAQPLLTGKRSIG
jgi:hypothetical protein